MKSLFACSVVLALAACGSSSTTTTSTGTSGNGSTTGAKSTGTSNGSSTGAHGSSTGSVAGSSTGSALGTDCTYSTTTGVDSCTDEGYECSGELTQAATGTCILPQDLAVCDADPNGDVGCQDGGIDNGKAGGTGDLFCSTGFQNSSGMVDLCLYNCVDTTDCPNELQYCITQLGGCFTNYCGFNTAGQFVGPYYGTCAVESAADGQCLSFNTGGLGVCFPNGTAQVGQPCRPEVRFGDFSECTYGNYCLPTASGDGGLCFPITVDGGTCPANNDVILAQTGADWAVCALDCTTSMDCDGGPVGTTCQTPTGSTSSFCLP